MLSDEDVLGGDGVEQLLVCLEDVRVVVGGVG